MDKERARLALKNVRRSCIYLTLAGLLAVVLFDPGYSMPAPAISVPDDVKQWESIQAQGTRAFEASEYGKAERLLTEALIRARALGADDLKFAKSAGELGRLLTVRARFSEAEMYLEEEYRIKLHVLGLSVQLIPAMGSLIKFYLTYGNASKADGLTEDMLFLIEGKMKDEISKVQADNNYKKGQPLHAWAGTAAPPMHGPLIEWAILMDEIGLLYADHGNYKFADRLFKSALDAKAAVLGKQHLSLANSYDNLGAICLSKGEDSDAESYMRDSLEITERILTPESTVVYGRMDKLARCLIKEGKLAQAEAVYLRAQKMFESEPSKCGNEARCLFALGCLYSNEKKFGEAAPVLRRALQISEQYNGGMSVAIVPYLRKYAYVLYYLGRRGETDALKLRADSIQPEVKPLKTVCKMEEGNWTKKAAPENEQHSVAQQRGGNKIKHHYRHKVSTVQRKSRHRLSGQSNAG